jgi:hypothetical protein
MNCICARERGNVEREVHNMRERIEHVFFVSDTTFPNTKFDATLFFASALCFKFHRLAIIDYVLSLAAILWLNRGQKTVFYANFIKDKHNDTLLISIKN